MKIKEISKKIIKKIRYGVELGGWFILIMLFLIGTLQSINAKLYDIFITVISSPLEKLTYNYWDGVMERTATTEYSYYLNFIEDDLDEIKFICENFKYANYEECVMEETFILLKYDEDKVFDYDFNNEKVCRDKAISYCAILRHLNVNCYPVLTKFHLFSVVEIDNSYTMVDLTQSWIGEAYVDNYFIGYVE